MGEPIPLNTCFCSQWVSFPPKNGWKLREENRWNQRQVSQFTHSHIAKYRCKRTGLECDTLSNLLRYCVGGWNCQVWGFFPGVFIYLCGYLWLLFGSMKDGKSPEPMSNTNVKPLWRGCLIWPICVCVCVREWCIPPNSHWKSQFFKGILG